MPRSVPLPSVETGEAFTHYGLFTITPGSEFTTLSYLDRRGQPQVKEVLNGDSIQATASAVDRAKEAIIDSLKSVPLPASEKIATQGGVFGIVPGKDYTTLTYCDYYNKLHAVNVPNQFTEQQTIKAVQNAKATIMSELSEQRETLAHAQPLNVASH